MRTALNVAMVLMAMAGTTACKESTPSASRAPPECQSPMIGAESVIARW